jgi:hypothetical protein
MTPQQYRSDYGLPDSYPMVAAEYAQMRSQMATSIGLGRKKAGTSEAPASAPSETKPTRRGRETKIEVAPGSALEKEPATREPSDT